MGASVSASATPSVCIAGLRSARRCGCTIRRKLPSRAGLRARSWFLRAVPSFGERPRIPSGRGRPLKRVSVQVRILPGALSDQPPATCEHFFDPLGSRASKRDGLYRDKTVGGVGYLLSIPEDEDGWPRRNGRRAKPFPMSRGASIISTATATMIEQGPYLRANFLGT